MKGEATSAKPKRVEFKPAPDAERLPGWVLLEARVDGHVLRVAARERDRKGLEEYVKNFQIAFDTVPVEDQAPQGHEFDDVVAVVAEAGRSRRYAGVVGIEIERMRDPVPGSMTRYVIDPPIGYNWLHIYYDGGTAATVSIDTDDTPHGQVRVHRIGDASQVVTSSWSGSAKGEFRILGEHSKYSSYHKTGLGTVSAKRRA
jgi:hypothetical protein